MSGITSLPIRTASRLKNELYARNYSLYKRDFLKKDLRFKDRREQKHPTFYDVNHKKIDVDKVLNDLLENGIVVVENLYSERWADRAYKKVMKWVEEYKKGKVKKSGLWSKSFGYDSELLKTGIIRFYNVTQKIPEAQEFANDKFLKYIGELYYQKKMRLQTVISQYNEVSKIPCRGYHVDSHTNQFKTFIYLNDVNKDNGPHLYLKGSNQNSEKILKKLHQVYSDQITGKYKASDSTGVTDKDAKKLNLDLLSATAKKGTVLIVDTRGVHQGGTLKKDHRVVFNTYYYVDD